MSNTVVIENISRLATMDGGPPHGLGLVENAAVVVKDGAVAWVGAEAALVHAGLVDDDATVLDAAGACVLPGLIDCHTHLLFAGDRCDEFARRARGESYAEISAAGGGIRSTMRAVREASHELLAGAARPRLEAMLRRGVTTAEVKSGYGLDVDNELKMLEVIRALGTDGPIELVPTLLAAHAIPPEHEGNATAYVDVIARELLPQVARGRLATACDVFVEQGAFTTDDARRLLRAAQDAGLAVRVHAEQLSRSGGAMLAAELSALSASHLEHVEPNDIEALARAGVVCEVLSIAQVFLRGQRAIPARALVDGGCTVAVATDCNPGTAMSTDIALAGGLAVTQCGLTVEEALLGMTRNAARALGLDDRGVIAPGKRGDLIVVDAEDPGALVYRWNEDLVRLVLNAGRIAFMHT